jgi:hypothetical protein
MLTPEDALILSYRHGLIHVIWDADTGVWTSPNVPIVLKPIPLKKQILEFAERRICRRPQWLYDRHPFLAFWPTHVRWEGPIFERLNISPDWNEVEEIRGMGFVMKPSKMCQWMRLEWALKDIAVFLLSQAKIDGPIDLAMITLPEEAGYTQYHRSQNACQVAVFRSRDAFVALACYLSFAIAAHISQNDAATFRTLEPQWIRLLRDRKIVSIWLDDLRKSFVYNFAPGFPAGAYVTAWSTRCGPVLDAFRVANVPLWIFWGKKRPKHMNDEHGMLQYNHSKSL